MDERSAVPLLQPLIERLEQCWSRVSLLLEERHAAAPATDVVKARNQQEATHD